MSNIAVHTAGRMVNNVQRCEKCGLTLSDGAGFEPGEFVAQQGLNMWVTDGSNIRETQCTNTLDMNRQRHLDIMGDDKPGFN